MKGGVAGCVSIQCFGCVLWCYFTLGVGVGDMRMDACVYPLARLVICVFQGSCVWMHVDQDVCLLLH